MSRLIDADELKKHAYKSGDWDKPMVVDVEDIDDAPTVNQWHYPSKGDLPKAWDFYIVAVSVTEGVGAFSTVMDYSPNANRWTDCTGHEEHHVIAWMPLPEPPKEEA